MERVGGGQSSRTVPPLGPGVSRSNAARTRWRGSARARRRAALRSAAGEPARGAPQAVLEADLALEAEIPARSAGIRAGMSDVPGTGLGVDRPRLHTEDAAEELDQIEHRMRRPAGHVVDAPAAALGAGG